MVHLIMFCLYMLLPINLNFYFKIACDKYAYEESEDEHLEFFEECDVCEEMLKKKADIFNHRKKEHHISTNEKKNIEER